MQLSETGFSSKHIVDTNERTRVGGYGKYHITY